MYCPPLAEMLAPVIKLGSPKRPTGMVLRISSGTSMIMLMALPADSGTNTTGLPVTNASFCPVSQLPLRLFRSLRRLKDDQRADLLYNSRPFFTAGRPAL